MTMQTALTAYLTATTADDVRDAYVAMLEWSDAPEDAPVDDVDTMLERMGLPSLADRLYQIEMADLRVRGQTTSP